MPWQIKSNGRHIDARFDVAPSDAGMAIIVESRGGTRGTSKARNVDYLPGLELILERLGQLGASIVEVLVDSSKTRSIPEAVRRLQIDGYRYPISTASVGDYHILRLAITRAAAQIGRSRSERQGSGNPTKRLRILITGTSVSEGALGAHLAEGTAPAM